jgi:hypothetical protein
VGSSDKNQGLRDNGHLKVDNHVNA